MPWIWLMSAGLSGAARVRRVRRFECGGEMECEWRLGDGVSRKERVEGMRKGAVREDVAGFAVLGVDESFGLSVAVGGNIAPAVEGQKGLLSRLQWLLERTKDSSACHCGYRSRLQVRNRSDLRVVRCHRKLGVVPPCGYIQYSQSQYVFGRHLGLPTAY